MLCKRGLANLSAPEELTTSRHSRVTGLPRAAALAAALALLPAAALCQAPPAPDQAAPSDWPVQTQAWQIARSLYKPAFGPVPIATIADFTIQRPAANRLHVRITFPFRPGTYPVIIWSHGGGGTKDNYQPLIRFWASHGYICIQPQHPDSRRYVDYSKPGARAKLIAAWDKRPAEIKLVLDNLDAIGERLAQSGVRIDTSKIGVGGHSFGAHTSQLIAGAVAFVDGQPRSFADSRPRCFLLISPQGRGGIFRDESWRYCTRPMLVITGTLDISPLTGRGLRWRLDAYNLSPPGNKFLVIIRGAWHGFGGITGPEQFRSRGPDNPKQIAYVLAASTAFWDAFLRDSKAARQFLESAALAQKSAGEVFMKHK